MWNLLSNKRKNFFCHQHENTNKKATQIVFILLGVSKTISAQKGNVT